MNKKIIIGLVIAGLVVAGGVYLYSRNKKGAEEKKPVGEKKDMATELDALEVLDILSKKDTPLSPDKIKKFVTLYTTNIDKDAHAKIKSVLSKKESEWSSQDKLTIFTLTDNVLKPLNTKTA